MLRLVTFGGLHLEREGQPLQLPTSKARELLAYLVTFRDRRHPRPVLAGTLWPDLPEEKARRYLSDTLWRVRSVLGDYVLADEEYIWFDADLPCWLDVDEFERASGVNAAAGLPGALPGMPALVAAVELYRGPFLDGFYCDWALLAQERLRGLALEILGRLVEGYKQAGDYGAALTTAQRLVAIEPMHEAAHQELMRLYHLLGRDSEALAQYYRCREVLQKELGVSPAPETEALYQALVHRLPAELAETIGHLPAPSRRTVPSLDQLPLAGRDSERSALLGHLEAAASGRGSIILLEGEAGIGKSRLAQEIIAGARWRRFGTVLARAEESDSSPYGLFLAALGPLLTPLRLGQLARLVQPHHLQAASLLLPLAAQAWPGLPPLPDLPPPQARERLQQALVALALGLAHIGPHLWVLEDLQRADAETLSLLTLLSAHLAETRMLVLLTGRSAELRASPAVWHTLQALDRAGPFPRYALQPLGPDAINSLVHDLLGQDDPALAGQLTQQSAGVPLYLVETLKAWRDEGYLQPTEQGTWRCQGNLPAAMPALGEAVIGYRLAGLSPAVEKVLATAAVIGPEVDFELLAYLYAPAGVPNDQATSNPLLLAAADELLRLEILVETDAGYRFSHEQVHRAVYHRLSRAQRSRLHREVAQAVAALFPEQFELLAHHFAAGGEREAAIQYLTRAAERARELFAHQAALACYERLLRMLTEPADYPLRHDVLRSRAEVLGWIGDREAQGCDLREMLALARTLADDVRLAGTLRQRGEWHWLQGHYGPANDDALAALEIYQRLGDDHGQAIVLNQLGRNLVYTGGCDQAAAYFQKALRIHEAVGDLARQIDCLVGLVAVTQYDGDLSQSLLYCQRSLALARQTGNPRLLSDTLSAMGVVYIDLGDMDAAETHLREALHLAETSGERHQQAVTHTRLAHVGIQRGDWEMAELHIATAEEMFCEMQDSSWGGYVLGLLGEVALLKGDPVAANRHQQAAYQCSAEIGEDDYAAIHLSYLALAEVALGNKAAAWQHSLEVVNKARKEWPGATCPPEIYYNHFRVAEATGHWAVARAALEKAADVMAKRAERISDPIWRGRYLSGLRVHRAIAEAMASRPPPGSLRVRMARASLPGHRHPGTGETVEFTWTVDAGAPDAELAEREGSVALRRHRIRRLLAEATAAGATPAVADLAGALDISPRTVRTDLAVLRSQGYTVRTRGTPS